MNKFAKAILKTSCHYPKMQKLSRETFIHTSNYTIMSGCTCSVTSSESTPLCTDSNEALQCQIWAGAAAGIHFLVLSRVVWLTLQQVALKSLGSKYRSSKGILSSVAISCFSLCMGLKKNKQTKRTSNRQRPNSHDLESLTDRVFEERER